MNFMQYKFDDSTLPVPTGKRPLPTWGSVQVQSMTSQEDVGTDLPSRGEGGPDRPPAIWILDTSDGPIIKA